MAEAQKKMMKPMTWALGGIGFLVTSFLTAGVNVMGLSFAGATLITTLILEIPLLRRKFGLLMGPPPSPASAARAAPSPAAAAAALSSIPAHIPKGIRYEAPRGAARPAARITAEEVAKPQSLAERLNSSLNDAKQGMSQQLEHVRRKLAQHSQPDPQVCLQFSALSCPCSPCHGVAIFPSRMNHADLALAPMYNAAGCCTALGLHHFLVCLVPDALPLEFNVASHPSRASLLGILPGSKLSLGSFCGQRLMLSTITSMTSLSNNLTHACLGSASVHATCVKALHM